MLFKNYEMVKLVETGEVIKSINIKKALSNLSMPLQGRQ